MSRSNSYKNIFKNLVYSFIDTLKDPNLNSRNLTDEQMECMQFGICDFVMKSSDEIPYFHF